MYAWKITTDHLFADDPQYDRTGTRGPRAVSDEFAGLLDVDAAKLPANVERHQFTTWDDDKQRTHSGLIVWDDTAEFPEDEIIAPLRDFATPEVGAVRITYHGHPEWTAVA